MTVKRPKDYRCRHSKSCNETLIWDENIRSLIWDENIRSMLGLFRGPIALTVESAVLPDL